MNYEYCEECTDPEIYPGKVFNNGDTSGGEALGQWAECEFCKDNPGLQPADDTCNNCKGKGVIQVEGHREACDDCGGLNVYSDGRGFVEIKICGSGKREKP